MTQRPGRRPPITVDRDRRLGGCRGPPGRAGSGSIAKGRLIREAAPSVYFGELLDSTFAWSPARARRLTSAAASLEVGNSLSTSKRCLSRSM